MLNKIFFIEFIWILSVYSSFFCEDIELEKGAFGTEPHNLGEINTNTYT